MIKIFIYFLAGTLISMAPDLNSNFSFDPSYQEQSFDRPLYPIAQPREEGFLKVSDLHQIFYATYGNPEGIPVVVLHGGPGAGCSNAMTQSFDLSRWNVVMFDQRGAMRSEPFGCMEENSPQHSISDMEALREHLGIQKWVVFGGSWGSSLALLYGQSHPDKCTGFILRGVWLTREQDYLHLFYGAGKMFPEAYESVVNHIPIDERHDLFSAYYQRVTDPDPAIQLHAAKTFMKFDMICATHLPNPALVNSVMQNDKLALGVMKTFCHYAKNEFFLKPNQILSEMDRISHLPAIIINGRWDVICPTEMAYLVHQKFQNSALWIVPNGGHSTIEPAIASALATATDIFAKEIENAAD